MFRNLVFIWLFLLILFSSSMAAEASSGSKFSNLLDETYKKSIIVSKIGNDNGFSKMAKRRKLKPHKRKRRHRRGLFHIRRHRRKHHKINKKSRIKSRFSRLNNKKRITKNSEIEVEIVNSPWKNKKNEVNELSSGIRIINRDNNENVLNSGIKIINRSKNRDNLKNEELQNSNMVKQKSIIKHIKEVVSKKKEIKCKDKIIKKKLVKKRIYHIPKIKLGYRVKNNRKLSKKRPWNIKRYWTVMEFDRYSKWIENIYNHKKMGTRKQKNSKLDEILSDPEMNLFLQNGYDDEQNPKLSSRDLSLMRAVTHCGSFPKLLLIYYSYKRGLPITVSYVRGAGDDIRYSVGNHPVHYIDNLTFSGNFRSFILSGIESSRYNHFTTGNFRTDPRLEDTDTVPMLVDKHFIKPGVIVYNAGGHALLVGKVTKRGEVYFLDAHPDHSISYSKDISVVTSVSYIAHPERCYGGFRMMRLAEAKKDDMGRVIGVVPMSNKEMEEYGYSIKQYEDIKLVRKRKLIINGKKVSSFHDYIRKNLRNSNIKDNPFEFIEKSALRLSDMFKTRKKFVEDGWADVLKNGPITFPNNKIGENIYQATGRWEKWSSPSSDVDRKCAVIYVGERLESMINSYIDDSTSIELGEYKDKISNSSELAELILSKLEEEFNKYSITYKTSLNEEKTLTLLQICDRLWALSFDPNNPPELRWGEPVKNVKKYVRIDTPYSDGRELSPIKSYNIQKNLRYYLERQDKPTKLSDNNNPTSPLEKLPMERLSNYMMMSVASKK